ncbi:MAG: response regulator [Anaerolineales bacterium]|nr:MAG: response regulator [Anaerolineales bacterium]
MVDKSRTILYVEDNLDNRNLVKRILEAAGFQFIGTDNAADGIALAQMHQPDLILVDINLPEVDGLTMTQELKADAQFEKTPIIAITANVMRGDRERTLTAGCDDYIQKPIDVDQLPRQIARFLHQ